MDKKKKIYRIINICMIVIPLIYINFASWANLLNEPETSGIIQNLNSSNTTELLQAVLLSYAVATFLYLVSPFGIITIGYIIYRIIKVRTIKKSQKHLPFDIEYFRDYLNKMSPAYVSYLTDFDIDIDRDIPAHILKLQLDGYIEEQNGTFIVTNKDKKTLHNSDIIVLEFVESNFQNRNKLAQYKSAVSKEMILNKYIKTTFGKNDITKLMSVFFISPIAIIIMMSLFAFTVEATSSIVIEIILGIIISLVIIIIPLEPIIFIIRLVTFIRWGRIKRTEKGNELLEQIYGLKNFLEDFTNIHDSNLNEAYLREYYLVYAVVLGINNIAGNTMLNKIKNQMNNNS